ncbi:MAG: HNH endonuclease [Bacillota bacterium]
MSTYNNFYDNLLPGNYFLTKSMELTKVNKSGTLWYTKKFLVLYYLIFLSNDIDTRSYITKAIDCFDTYISDLHESVRDQAYSFFYPDNNVICLKSEHFKTFTEFAGHQQFENNKHRVSHTEMAKKYYFALLMESGGQGGVNEKIKEAINSEDFVYTYERIKNIIDTYYNFKPNINYNQKINDYMAFLRNERQVLYYYGFFHSKTTGANDREFSSLTPVGELALEANSKEFQCIWEHQKFKMISQPVTVEIDKISPRGLNLDSFSLNFNPYLDIIEFLLRNGAMTKTEFQYILSRKNRNIDNQDWIDEEACIIDNLSEIIRKVTSFDRSSDVRREDSNKELLKYLLGLRSDLPKDNGTNFIGCCKMKRNGVEVTSEDILRKISNVYSSLNSFKQAKYHALFESCEEELRRKYIASANRSMYTVDPQIKISWDLYNIRPDKQILLGIIIAFTQIELGIELITENADAIAHYAFESYNSLLRRIGLRRISAVRSEVRALIMAILSGDYTNYLREEDEDERREIRATYLEMSTADLFEIIKQSSNTATTQLEEDRSRNVALISQMKSYYIQRFANEQMLNCECCHEETFLTSSNEPYVEFHHLIPFGGGHYGPDHYLNIYALCPDCHRRIHFMNVNDKQEYYTRLSANNYFNMNFIERLRELHSHRLLRSFQLEFLLADRAITQDEYDRILA